ncbi:cold-shock protein [Jeotgalibacillus sp. S-D1]|nr:cold-shock protein [Jeotgalibacillus sp. S-D1]
MFQRKPTEEVVKEDTAVWECSSDECKGWMRANFSSHSEGSPTCPICGSKMDEGTRLLEVIPNPRKF